MKHTYLSAERVAQALKKRAITAKEAKKLMKKIDSQVSIYKSIHKQVETSK